MTLMADQWLPLVGADIASHRLPVGDDCAAGTLQQSSASRFLEMSL
jgi:hypothetical protein